MKKSVFTLIAFILCSSYISAQTTTFSGTGNWNAAARWSNGIPTSTKSAIIANGAVCTINIGNATCADLTVATGNTNTSIVISGSNVISITGDVIIQAPTANNRTKLIDVGNGTMNVAGDFTLSATSADSRSCEVDIGNGTLNLTGNMILNGTNNLRSIINFTGNGVMNIKGTITGGGNLIEGNGTINYNNNGDQILTGTTYNNLIISGSGDKAASGTVTVNGALTLTAGNLSINGQTLNINGDISNGSGRIMGSPTSNIVVAGNGGNAILRMDQTSSSSRSLNNLTVSRQNGINLNDTLEIDNTLTVNNNANLSANGRLILVSNAAGTARVADLSNGTVSGTVITERFIPGGNNRRRWRLLASPVNAGGSVTYAQLKDDITVTGAGGSANLFDDSPQNSASARTYTESVAGASSLGWNNPVNINVSIPTGRGISVFVRGSRGLPNQYALNTVPDDATIDFVGTLNQGDVNISSQLSYTNTGNPTADGFCLVGNPYMSQIDWQSASITKSNIGNFIYILNPATGSYGTYDASTNTGLNGATRYIASTQGFFVRTTAANAQLIFREPAKTTANPSNLFRVRSAETFPKIRLSASRDADNTDELVIVLGDTAHKTAVDQSDVFKFFNDNNLNFYTRSTSDLRNLAINYFPTPQQNDTIHVSIFSFVDGVKALGTYQINIKELLNIPGNIDLFLWDTYANQMVNMKHTSAYVFNLDANALSAGNERFKIIFKPDNSVNTKILNFEGKANANHISLNWSTNKERHTSYFFIEKSLDQKKFTRMKPNEVYAYSNNEGFNKYIFADATPSKGFNYYRISMVDSSGNISSYGEVVAVNWGTKANVSSMKTSSDKPSISFESERLIIYPNPTKDVINVNVFTQQENVYKLTIIDISGREVLELSSVSSQQLYTLDVSSLEKGLYLVKAESKNGEVIKSQKFIKE